MAEEEAVKLTRRGLFRLGLGGLLAAVVGKKPDVIVGSNPRVLILPPITIGSVSGGVNRGSL